MTKLEMFVQKMGLEITSEWNDESLLIHEKVSGKYSVLAIDFRPEQGRRLRLPALDLTLFSAMESDADVVDHWIELFNEQVDLVPTLRDMPRKVVVVEKDF